MGQVYSRKLEFHPSAGKEAIRKGYIVLLRELVDDLEEDSTLDLPVTILAKLNTRSASDYAELQIVCFGNRLDVQHINRFLDADGIAL